MVTVAPEVVGLAAIARLAAADQAGGTADRASKRSCGSPPPWQSCASAPL
jgi:hypothetical protein